jgi:magnesium transporter
LEEQRQEGCWINVSDPNQDDFTYLEEMGVPESFISDIRDPNERPRVEKDGATKLPVINSNILTGSMEAFGSIISNNLNLIMKRMTSITIILQVPTLIASLYGMNVTLPIDDKAWAFVAILLLSMALSCAAFFVFKKIKWF